MNYRFGFAPLLAACSAMLLASPGASAAAVQAEHVSVELISESTALVPGKVAWLGLHLRHDPHWHSYWINPGDSGLPTRLKWSLPDGYTADPIVWPAPSRFEISGLYNFGYADEVVLPVAIHVPENATPGQSAALALDARWLVCREECITGKATLNLELPVAEMERAGESAGAKLFTAARDSTPEPATWTGKAQLNGDQIEIRLDGAEFPEIAGLDVFAVERRVLASAPAEIRREGESLVIIAQKNDYYDQAPATLDLVLTSRMTNGHVRSWQVRVPFMSPATPG